MKLGTQYSVPIGKCARTHVVGYLRHVVFTRIVLPWSHILAGYTMSYKQSSMSTASN